MAKLALGYGSEWHLLRYLARFREYLDQAILLETGGGAIRWLPVSSKPNKPDAEWKGIAFLPPQEQKAIRSQWNAWWPSRNQSWDAIGQLDNGDWLLVEAKGYPQEAKTNCAAEDANSLKKIKAALDNTKQFLGADMKSNWLKGYYQTANRLACLRFLAENDVPARLVFINFTGDVDRSGKPRKGAQTAKEWQVALRDQRQHLGLPAKHELSGSVHTVFLPV